MKKKRIITIVLALITSISFITCVEDADFKVPESLGNEENEAVSKIIDSISFGTLQLKTIKQLKELYIIGNDPLEIVSDIVVKGYVVSSDKSGNFYKEFYMQDAPENPTAGIRVALNLSNSYNKFNIGREIYIRLKGLYVGETNSGDGNITIGGKISTTDLTEIENVTTNQIPNHIYRTEITEDIIPKLIPFGGINASNIGTFIMLENVFFDAKLLGKSYVDPKEDFDTQRKIKTCLGLGYDELLVETSSFSRFSNETLPEKAGTINAVVSKDYGGDLMVLVLNDTNDVSMNNERCIPLPAEEYSTILLSENFDNESGDIDVLNWINFREEGTKSWRSYTDTYAQSKAARVNSINSGDESTITWLITSGINLDNTSQEFLSFETSNSFGNGSELQVLISTDFNGKENNINTAIWTVLPAKIVSDGENYKNWMHSTYIDLSAFSGTAFISFKYTGNGNVNFDGTYELDNVIINAKE
ncbi:DUF5689 domain-containing protein [Polaribacter undariae]|uniref:DUF5689 domain-containing protein n=1 Tax=Polaribacter sejongensis TaxID=985043 RepID=A0AAJ1R1J9_9FLAO|nr:DUF5689 domain-containing protein [Polaribacter undariae]MDN3621001.1 DUF5689 domain-containing protein [Polaribacter undariae]UWD31133.1 DUF5689 domain-containing protein [Polaribacter undariae]